MSALKWLGSILLAILLVVGVIGVTMFIGVIGFIACLVFAIAMVAFSIRAGFKSGK